MKQRLVGAVVLVALAVIFIPMLLKGPADSGPIRLDSIQPSSDRSADPPVPASAEVTASDQAAARLSEIEALSNAARSADSPPSPEPEVVPVQPDEQAPTPARIIEPEPEPAPEPESEAPAEDWSGAWVVQVGSFSRGDNAVALRDRLRAKGYKTFVETVTGQSGTMTRVYADPTSDRAKAEAARDSLNKQLKLKGLVVKNPRAGPVSQ